jgi:hypothetical protein
LVYVDDIIFGCTNESSFQWFTNSMQIEFEISMIGELSYFLGLQVKQSSAGIFISQEKYLKEMLKKFQMEDSSLVRTPMVVGCKMSKDDISPDVDQRTYLSMIGSLLYITSSRPNIMQAVGMVGRYQFAPKQSHLVEGRIHCCCYLLHTNFMDDTNSCRSKAYLHWSHSNSL